LPYTKDFPQNRLGLAQWLLHPDNPLTARVIVNRYWQTYFGQGLHKNTNDFGNQGGLPSHPELLDYLAVTFRKSKWDVKAMQKLLVMSATYRNLPLPQQKHWRKTRRMCFFREDRLYGLRQKWYGTMLWQPAASWYLLLVAQV
jgi:hypothetical protein